MVHQMHGYRLSLSPGDGGLTKRLADLLSELAEEVTRRLVVADGKECRNTAASVGKTFSRAVDGSAANRRGVLPDDLGEVSPAIEGGVVVDAGRSGLAIQASEVANLVVVEQLGDDGRDVAGWCASSDVLTVSSTIGSYIVGIHARASNLLGCSSEAIIPSKSWRGVVGAMRVMVSYNSRVVVAGCGLAGT